MPPLRNISTSVKPTKTERTHEENQERAYIAASRRSDRSIEARIESAKRASEIHKKRTGRPLRITQEDVENEEMYEEEDGDFRMNMRNLAAAQQYANSPAFHNLQAFLATQAALAGSNQHSLMMGASQPNQAPPQPAHNPYLAHLINQRLMQMTQMQLLNQQQQHQQEQTHFQQQHSPLPQSPSANSQGMRSPTSYRQSPYPISTGLNQTRPVQHHRSASIAIPAETDISTVDSQDQSRPSISRRNSMPAQTATSEDVTRPQLPKTASSTTSSPVIASEHHASSDVSRPKQTSTTSSNQVMQSYNLQNATNSMLTSDNQALATSQQIPNPSSFDMLSPWLSQSSAYTAGNSNPYGSSVAFNPMMLSSNWPSNTPVDQPTWPTALQTDVEQSLNNDEDPFALSATSDTWSVPQSGVSLTNNNLSESLTLSPGMPDGKAQESRFPDEWSSFINEDDSLETHALS